MFMLKVLFRSKTGGYLAFFIFCLILGVVGEIYYPSGALRNFDGLFSWFLVAVMGIVYGVIALVLFTVIKTAILTAYDDLKETTEKVRNEEK